MAVFQTPPRGAEPLNYICARNPTLYCALDEDSGIYGFHPNPAEEDATFLEDSDVVGLDSTKTTSSTIWRAENKWIGFVTLPTT